MDPKDEVSAAKLTDDLVMEILSRLPFKSFCRFKCVCKAWLAFSSDPHYCQKLPKVPTGFFYQDCNNNAIKVVSLSKNDEDIDVTLSFLPDYEQFKLTDCCNGLVLCEYRSDHTSPDILRFIVCNPAT
uniref:F-box domain-containing protein n=1 Tax=Arundo donax TaxID=35708 RepID=A0A0A8Y2W0_ARUDO